MENNIKSRVEIFDVAQNNWTINSWHKNKEHAVINADVISKSRKCRARVICEGLIVHETPWDKLAGMFDGVDE